MNVVKTVNVYFTTNHSASMQSKSSSNSVSIDISRHPSIKIIKNDALNA